MTTAGNAIRLSARLACQHASRQSRRGFRAAASDRAAQNFTMPALSPTMTEGNIAKWNKKEGDAFTAGDVLLEIETDKATMDVEAQDDGIVFKILSEDGSKGVQVGERIAVMAEEGDDISTLELPANSGALKKAEAPKEEAPKPEPKVESKKGSAGPQQASAAEKPSAQAKAPTEKQRYPLYPSVQHLLHENGMSKDDADKIPASGPNGRLMKGDVLAYLGRIEKDYSASQSKRLEKLGHLDLSNIQLAPPLKAPEQNKADSPAAAPELPRETEIAMPISLSAVIATQKRVQDTLGIFLPLSTFIARASELANEDLPASKTREPSSSDLFNAVLGLRQAPKISRGNFMPNIVGLSPVPMTMPIRATKKADIIDMLAPKPAAKKANKASAVPTGISPGPNVFSVSTPKGDESRATEYLERMKKVLEAEPGRLVL